MSPQPDTQRRRTMQMSDDDGSEGGVSSRQGDGVHEMATKLVRLALACEYQRKPIRRADIGEKVLGPNGRQFKPVFIEAQTHLRYVFGMEMIELPAKDKATVQQRRAAQKSATQAKATTSSWILVSTLPYELRRPDIVKPPAAPTTAEDAKYTAIYSLIVTLIALSGGNLPDSKMERYLRKLQIDDRTPVDGYHRTELLLKRMEKDGYVVKVKESTGTGEDDVYWIVGPRGKVEVGRNGVTGLTKAVYGDQEDEAAEEELERRIARSLALDVGAGGEQDNTQPGESSKRRPRKKRSTKQNEEDEDEDEDEDEEDVD